MSAGDTSLDIAGTKVPVSHLDKVFYPKAGFTKGQVLDYYIRISPVLLPHLRNRALTLKRYPNGVEGGFFYEKRCPAYRPKWVNTVAVWSERNHGEIQYCLANDLPSLVWAVNLGDLEIHTSLASSRDVDRPTMVAFDLDPGAPANIVQCAEVALLLKQKFDDLSLKCFAKTSGSKGMQVYVPLNTPATYDMTKGFAHRMAIELENEHPGKITSNMSKAVRKGKVFVDWSQNDRHKTTVCVYSLRAKDYPSVSTPIEWGEVETTAKKRDSEILTFLSHDTLKRVEKYGDLFEPVLKLKQKLPRER